MFVCLLVLRVFGHADVIWVLSRLLDVDNLCCCVLYILGEVCGIFTENDFKDIEMHIHTYIRMHI